MAVFSETMTVAGSAKTNCIDAYLCISETMTAYNAAMAVVGPAKHIYSVAKANFSQTFQ